MKIFQLTVENVKKLKVVDITPRGHIVQITSKKNGQGKTSVLDSIWWLLTNAKNIQSVPIRAGAEEARIRGVLGDTSAELVVERRFLPSGTTTLTVRDARGSAPGTPDKKLPKWSEPREILDALIGDLSFDPLQFARETQKDQFEHLVRVAKVDVDFDAINAANEEDFRRRRDVNRDAKAKRAQAEGISVPGGLPDAPIDETELLNEMQSAADHNASIEQSKARRERAQSEANRLREEGVRSRKDAASIRERTIARVAEMRRQIEVFEREQEASATEVDKRASDSLAKSAELEKKINSAPALPAPIDISGIRARIGEAKSTNAAIAQRERLKQITTSAEALEKEASRLTQQIQGREEAKIQAIKAAQMPLEGLGLGDGIVTYNGIPFDQASDGEALRVSAEIAMHENPRLRVIRIRDGSLLDDDNLSILARMAAERDYQIWIEQVDRTGKVGIVMEDGEVVADYQEEQENV